MNDSYYKASLYNCQEKFSGLSFREGIFSVLSQNRLHFRKKIFNYGYYIFGNADKMEI